MVGPARVKYAEAEVCESVPLLDVDGEPPAVSVAVEVNPADKDDEDRIDRRRERRNDSGRSRETLGLYMQYFAVGVIYGGLPSTIYGFFLGYLNVESYVYSTAATVVALPWSFKFLFGALNDCVPIYGYRRKPYMVIGWTICTLALIRLATMELPRPYWCYNGNRDGYQKQRAHSGGGVALACNPRASKMGGRYALWMMIASLGYCIADVAADGLTVTIARAESTATRGTTQTTIYLVRTLGNVFAVMIVGLCMNSWEYNGTFQWGLSFSAIMGLFAVPAAVMIPVSWVMVKEQRVIFIDDSDDDDDSEEYGDASSIIEVHHPRGATTTTLEKDDVVGQEEDGSLLEDSLRAEAADANEDYDDEPRVERRRTFRQYLRSTWELLRGRAMFYVILYEFLTPLIGNISTTAGGEVKQHWAHVKTLQNSCFSLVGLGLFAYGLWLVKTRFLGSSWRQSMLITTLFLNCLDMPFTFLTIFDVVRNQYFYLGETVLVEIPAAANFVIATFVIVEMAEGGDEGLVYGLLTTTANLGSPVASAISNQLFGLFTPALSNADNYIEDTQTFRNVVAKSFAVSYFFAFLSLLTLPLLPDQKAQAQERKRLWRKSDFYAYCTVTIVGLALLYSISVNFMAMYPSTTCLRIAGGPGC